MGLGIGLPSPGCAVSGAAGAEACLDRVRPDLSQLNPNFTRVGLPSPDCAVSGAAEALIESARHPVAGGGCVPLHWICGLFAGSLPPEQSCTLLDWVLLNEDRFAGVYLTAALLGIFGPQLVCMSGSDIKLWLQRVAAGSGDWYSLGVQTPGPVQQPPSWPVFVRG